MSDDLLKALGRVGREEREAAEQAIESAPLLSEIAREQMASRALSELGTLPKASSRRPTRVLIASGLALAAAFALWVGARPDVLPAYTLSVQGGTTAWRALGADAGTDRIEVRADGSLEILVRPETPLSRPVQARAFAVRDGATRDLPVEVSTQGVARVAGRVDALLVPATAPSEWSVAIVIGPAGDVPATLAEAQARSGLRVVETKIAVTP